MVDRVMGTMGVSKKEVAMKRVNDFALYRYLIKRFDNDGKAVTKFINEIDELPEVAPLKKVADHYIFCSWKELRIAVEETGNYRDWERVSKEAKAHDTRYNRARLRAVAARF
jgi:hypothetical protein